MIKENKDKDKEITRLSNNKKEINLKLKNIINEYEEEIKIQMNIIKKFYKKKMNYIVSWIRNIMI